MCGEPCSHCHDHGHDAAGMNGRIGQAEREKCDLRMKPGCRDRAGSRIAKGNALDAARRSWVIGSGKTVHNAYLHFISRRVKSRIENVKVRNFKSHSAGIKSTIYVSSETKQHINHKSPQC